MEVTQIKRELHDHLTESRDIIGPVDSVRRSAGTGVPPADEAAESAAKERKCVRYHRSNGRAGRAPKGIRATAKGG